MYNSSLSSHKNAIILAAGFGLRMVPINYSITKGLIEVNEERLIERLINQLYEVGVRDICVVVGFMHEKYDYLKARYGVDIVYNCDFTNRNNLHSLSIVADRIKNTYIVPCDIWCRSNPFDVNDDHSWYLVTNIITDDSSFRINGNNKIITFTDKGVDGKMIGIAYITDPQASIISKRLKEIDNEQHSQCFWEEVLKYLDKNLIDAKIIDSFNCFDINTYEQLREVDSNSSHLKTDVIRTITTVLNCQEHDIVDINILKKGMTNRSFIFTVKGYRYIMRIPGEGTDKLISRDNEAEVFRTIRGKGLCDDPVYINPKNGYKITKYLEGIRTCDPKNNDDLEKCMKMLRCFHNMKLTVPHSFDILEQIEFYEDLREGVPSIFDDYYDTKAKVFSLNSYVDNIDKDWCLTHIDAIPDNFLFYQTENGEELQLTDWEYSGMQDPHVDIAMFCIYSLYGKQECDHLIDLYFEGNCDVETRAKIYCYIAMCGLLWSNWCEYKQMLGVEFGEYSLRQYRYAKEYFRYAKELIGGKYGIE